VALRLGDPHQEIKTRPCLLCQKGGIEAWRSASGNKNPGMSIVPEGWRRRDFEITVLSFMY